MNDSIQIEELTSELQMVYQYLRKLGFHIKMLKM